MKKSTVALVGAAAGATLTVGLIGVVGAAATTTPTTTGTPGLGSVVGVVLPAAGESCSVPGTQDGYTCTTNDGTGHQTLSYTCTVPRPGDAVPMYRCVGGTEGKQVTVTVASDCNSSGTFSGRFAATTCDASAKTALKAAVGALPATGS